MNRWEGESRPAYFLSDCVSKDAKSCTIFLVEHGPLSETARRARDRVSHAILDIDLELATVVNVPLDIALDHHGLKAIIAGLGVGIHVPDFPGFFQIELLRYSRIVVVTSNSGEGLLLRNVTLELLKEYLAPLVDAGLVYAPVASVSESVGDEELYRLVMSDEAFENMKLLN